MKNVSLKKKVILSSVVLALFSAPTLYATQSENYRPELDTKQIQPHTADEISNGPKAEGALGQHAHKNEEALHKGAKNNPHADERGSVKANQASPEFEQDKAKCQALVGHSQNECLVDLQKKYNLPL